MYPFGGILISPLIAGYLASVLCRVQRSKGKRPGFVILLLASVAGVLASWLSMFQLDLFNPARWMSNGKVEMWMLLVISGIPSLFVSAIAATLFVARHQKSFDETHPAV